MNLTIQNFLFLLLLFAVSCGSGEKSVPQNDSDKENVEFQEVFFTDQIETENPDLDNMEDAGDSNLTDSFKDSKSENVDLSDDGLADEMQDIVPDSQDGEETENSVPEINLYEIPDYQSGPVRIRAYVKDADNDKLFFKVLFSTDNYNFAEASPVLNSGSYKDSIYTFFWNSRADIKTDTEAYIRLEVSDKKETVSASSKKSFLLMNNPDFERSVITTHAMNTGNENIHRISLLSVNTEGNLYDKSFPLEVSDEPDRIIFHPTGKHAYVSGTNWKNSIVDILHMDKKAGITGHETSELSLSSVTDLDISADGGIIYFANSGTDPAERGIYAYELNNDGSFGKIIFHKDIVNPSNLTIFPDNKKMIIQAGIMDQKYPFETVLSTEGESLFESVEDLGYNTYGPAITDNGDYVILVNENMFSPSISLLSMSENSFKVTETQEYESANDAVIHGDYVLVSRLEKNRVSFFHITKEGLKSVSDITSLPLASSMDIIREGKLSGYVLVSCVTEVYILNIDKNGTVSKTGNKINLGLGAKNIIDDIAVQP